MSEGRAGEGVKTAAKGKATAGRGKAAPTKAATRRPAKAPARGRRPAAAAPKPVPRRAFRWPEWRVGAALRRDIIAVGLVVLALLTLLSLLGTRGGILGLWGDALRRVFGWAAILVPLALLGWVADAFRAHPVAPFGPRRRHVLGSLLLLAAILGILHLPASDQATMLAWGATGQGGGELGYLIAAPLVAALRPVGAGLVLLGVATIALMIALNTNLPDIWRAFVALGRAARRAFGPRHVAPASPAVTTLARPAPAAPPEPEAAPLPEREAPVINLPPSAATAQPAAAAPDEPAAPLVVGAGQLPLPGAPDAPGYTLPALADLPLYDSVLPDRDELDRKARRIEETLTAFKVEARVREINPGAAVTQFALEPGLGVSVRRIKSLENDLALALAATSINIETPIPGQPRVGVVIPNLNIAKVGLRETMESKEFARSKAKLPVALGRDVNARYIVADLARMPHLLIAGSTGSGKSVCLNAIISTFLLTRTPEELKLVMIDPKMVELVGYNGIPHLKSPVVVEMDKVVGTLRKALSEMERRYQLFSKLQVRNIDGYQARRALDPALEQLPYLVIIIDELADLMMTAPDEIETVLVRLAQMARATGIHLIIATQRPSVDVLTGLIKANFPARIAFAVTSQIDSRVILDMPGAERLLGRGDMLFQDPSQAKPTRVQGAFVDDPDIERIVADWRREVPQPRYEPEWINVPAYTPGGEGDDEDKDAQMLEQALDVVQQHGTISTSMLQRRLRIGYNRAARLIEQLEEEGYIGPSEGARGRAILHGRDRRPGGPGGVAPPFDDE
ncbi:MAG TPA: DNA translocase FtsK 4TM domain-containing protein [Thermomicrobiales bacterium]|nr:DNA translocase FtsK 4TM domain-containing protein [Thermomicrobiales bacterium]